MKQWQRRILFTAWITYASFYLLRVNMSIAIPGIIKEFGISKTSIGAVLTALFFAYAIGQFINGQLGDKFGAKKIVAIGLLTSAIVNIVFGFTGNFLAGMILLWGLNGFFQAMGWAPIVKTVACWFPAKVRGRASGILGTSYIFGSAASWLLAGLIVGALGWRWAFWLPGLLCVGFVIYWLLRIKNSCEDAGFSPVEEVPKSKGVKDNIVSILKNKEIWIVAFGLFGLNIVRYGFLDWAPTYFYEVQKASISLSAYKALIFPVAGILGSLFAGRYSDRIAQGKRALVAAIMLILLGVAALFFPHIPTGSWSLSLAVLAIIGFLTFGPHMLMVTALPMDLGTKERAASTAGFIDGWGYVGAALTGVGTGLLLDNFSWNYAFYFWIAGAFIAAFFMFLLSRINIKSLKYFEQQKVQ
ncbi:MFS transporter [Patescibacteria group bacterium]|nr:MFS transporter [Patescibacteria group bacterium]